MGGFSHGGHGAGVDMVPHYSCSLNGSLALRRHNGVQDSAVLGRGHFMLVILT